MLPDSPLQQTSEPSVIPRSRSLSGSGATLPGWKSSAVGICQADMQGNFLTGDFLSHRITAIEMQGFDNRFVAKLCCRRWCNRSIVFA
ncbi:MAG: hypothetical protein U0744_15535 [Gemmataceae bacterium]